MVIWLNIVLYRHIFNTYLHYTLLYLNDVDYHDDVDIILVWYGMVTHKLYYQNKSKNSKKINL